MRSESTFSLEPFSWLSESEWEGAVNRTTPDYIRWVQSSLNRTWGLRLAVDGIEGPATRAAVRSFQQRQGLTVDGIVGPITEAALVAAGAPLPPVSVSAATAGGGSTSTSSKLCSSTDYLVVDVLKAFVQGSDELTPKHVEQVKKLAERLTDQWETHSLLIRGHASLEGPKDFNYELAARRAANVSEAIADRMQALVQGSAGYIDWDVVSCGEAYPIARASDPDLRRVEVCFRKLPEWYETGGNPPTRRQPVRAGNDVKYFIDGRSTFEEMARVIRTAKSRDHYIYLLGWWLDDSLNLVRGKSNSNLLSPPVTAGLTPTGLFWQASQSGVQVRAMLWDDYDAAVGSPNPDVVNRINGLRYGAAILDTRVLIAAAGSHHQKILIVRGNEGLIGFCGGIDINPDRISTEGTTRGAPFHDVHCSVKGPAAHDLLKIFLQRWDDHPTHRDLDLAKGALRGWRDDPEKQTAPLRPAGKMYVQIGRTYGNGSRNVLGIPGFPSFAPNGYSFAPNGERTAFPMILKAIAEAKKFIYIEDQYLVSTDVSTALANALRQPDLIVIILIPHAEITFLGYQTQFRRREFIRPLRQAVTTTTPGKTRVGVYFLNDPTAPVACIPGARGTYVHSKMMVVDDQFATIGSVNLCRRSLTHDSEVVAGIYDPSPDSLAKRVRIALWAKHLRLPASALADAVASAKNWFAIGPGITAGAGVCAYDENQNVEWPAPQAVWDEVDPDGR
jgi:phosphatidylserine/phosphatidylglycerophosphate/cardiolipin synthase-like enzyme/outer membrane protein OmpA-like peptidoglycan-associated protein